jgi:hypothetical protein
MPYKDINNPYRRKKIAVIGDSLSACVSIPTLVAPDTTGEFNNYVPGLFNQNEKKLPELDFDIDWYISNTEDVLSVGEDTTPLFTTYFHDKLGFSQRDYELFDASYRSGMEYIGWGPSQDYRHDWHPSTYGLHINTNKIKDHIREQWGNHKQVRFSNRPAVYSQIDADYIIDCSDLGADSKNYEEFNYIPVNAALTLHCKWDYPRFNYTKSIAMPYGYVLMTPLLNRCNVTYVYNSDLNTQDDLQDGVDAVLKEYNLTREHDPEVFKIKNYYRSKIFDGRVIYNGSKAFSVDPLETGAGLDTVLMVMDGCQRKLYEQMPDDIGNQTMTNWFKTTELIICMHYAAGTKYKTPFWEFAVDRGISCLSNGATKNIHPWAKAVRKSKPGTLPNLRWGVKTTNSWTEYNMFQNINGLGLGALWDKC